MILVRLINEFLSNKVISIPILTWFIIQSAKVIVDFYKNKRIDFKRFVGAGGMPSSHAATVTSLATVVGKVSGIESSQFGICIALAAIVMYDAAGVRRAAGKQAQVLNQLINHTEDFQLDVKLKELLGHTPIEVIVGAISGIILALFMYRF